MYHSSSSVYMMNSTPTVMKKHHKNTELESHQKAKIFFLKVSSFSSLDGQIKSW